MLRLLFVMVTTVLIGLGSGYFLWGSRVARMTESLSGLTLELDTMKARLAAPHAAASAPEAGAAESGAKQNEELRVINESLAALRVEVGEQKALLEKVASATPTEGASAAAELKTARNDLAACITDRQDLEVRCSGVSPSPAPAPNRAPTYPSPRYGPATSAPPAAPVPNY